MFNAAKVRNCASIDQGRCFQLASEAGSLKCAGRREKFSVDRGVAGILMTLRTC
jgi:hypothetical protein